MVFLCAFVVPLWFNSPVLKDSLTYMPNSFALGNLCILQVGT